MVMDQMEKKMTLERFQREVSVAIEPKINVMLSLFYFGMPLHFIEPWI